MGCPVKRKENCNGKYMLRLPYGIVLCTLTKDLRRCVFEKFDKGKIKQLKNGLQEVL